MIAGTLLVVGVLSLGAVVVPSTRQSTETSARTFMLQEATNQLETVMATAPNAVVGIYGSLTLDLAPTAASRGVTLQAATITFNVDNSTPELLVVQCLAAWTVGGRSEQLLLGTEIYNANP